MKVMTFCLFEDLEPFEVVGFRCIYLITLLASVFVEPKAEPLVETAAVFSFFLGKLNLAAFVFL